MPGARRTSRSSRSTRSWRNASGGLRLGVGAAAALVGASLALLAPSCASAPPASSEDLCALFAERADWHRAAHRAFERWGVPEPLQIAFVHQESRFRARARPPRRRLLGVLPGPRPSSAYGFAQVKDGTWDDYRRATGRSRASRSNFADAVDFIGWYGDRIHRLTGVARADGFRLYLAYHEGPAGYRRGSHRDKGWLHQVARKVDARARRYAAQHVACKEPPPARRFFFF